MHAQLHDHSGMEPETAVVRPPPGLRWRKSSASSPSGNCVELAGLPDGGVAVRNSRDPAGLVLVYTRAEMTAFLRGARSGEFDDLVE